MRSLSPNAIDHLVFYGEDIADLATLASQAFPANQVAYFKKTATEDQFEDMLVYIKNILQPADQILLKGSNSMNLAKVVEELEQIR